MKGQRMPVIHTTGDLRRSLTNAFEIVGEDETIPTDKRVRLMIDLANAITESAKFEEDATTRNGDFGPFGSMPVDKLRKTK